MAKAVQQMQIVQANYRRCVFILSTGIGTAGNDVVITLDEADTAAGGNVQALAKITRIDHKVGATAINAVGQFTTVTQTAAASYDSDPIAEAENEALIVIEVNAEDLSAGFDFIKFDVNDVGTGAQIGSAIYLLMDPRYPEDPMPTGIA
jgi:hypothetical protein